MKTIDPDSIKIILATDCGSTTTKAILIQWVNGEYRQTHRGEAPTTVEAPFADVTIGVINAVTEVSELAGMKLVDANGRITGCDLYISTSSAGGGLQMLVAGVIRQMTAESAKRAALGAGAIVMDVIASNDDRRPHDQIQRIRELRPDIILVSGGTDGGTTTHVVQIAELIAPAKPQPRFGRDYCMPLIFAGNKDAAPLIEKVFDDSVDLSIVENLRPVLERENLGPARDKIHDVFLEHVMAHAPGYDKLMSWVDAPIMPTPGAVGNILQTIAERQKINAVGVDINSASASLLSYVAGLGPVLAKNVVRWREENRAFRTRRDLLKVPRLGAKAFEQAAGFLRIAGGSNVLDASGVHPERYGLVERMAKDQGSSVEKLLTDGERRSRIDPDRYVGEGVGRPTIDDILEELARPGRDPRPAFEAFSFAEVHALSDLKPGMVLPGIVTNVTAFGAFVDIGVHQDGLVHVSQLADHFVKDPNEVVRVRQQVQVRVLQIDSERKRISLSMKKG